MRPPRKKTKSVSDEESDEVIDVSTAGEFLQKYGALGVVVIMLFLSYNLANRTLDKIDDYNSSEERRHKEQRDELRNIRDILLLQNKAAGDKLMSETDVYAMQYIPWINVP